MSVPMTVTHLRFRDEKGYVILLIDQCLVDGDFRQIKET